MGLRVALVAVGKMDDQARPQMSIVREGIIEWVRRVARADTQVDYLFPDKSLGHGLTYIYPMAVNETFVVKKIIEAERQGYDAVILNCFRDTGLQLGRSAVNIPVMGPCESAVTMAQLVGRKFAIVTVSAEHVPIMVRNLEFYKCEHRFISKPIRHFDPWYWDALVDAFKGKPAKLISDFEKVALECVEDGADVVIPGCFFLGAAFVKAGYKQVGNTGVPVLSASTSTIKLAEAMADLKHSIGLTKSHALNSLYRPVPEELMERMRQLGS